MIIFNLSGLLYVGIMFILMMTLFLTMGQQVSKDHLGLISAIISVPVAFILELLKMKPRLFFIPAWIMAIIFYIVQSWVNWHWYSILIDIPVLIAFYLLYMFAEKNIEKVRDKLPNRKLFDQPDKTGT